MRCPVCREVDLAMMDRQGIEIDYCPRCRGVWLDRGELDKLIERSSGFTAPPAAAPERGREAAYGYSERAHDRDDDDDDRHRRGHGDGGYRPRERKRGGFLGELFDFD